MAAGLVFKDVAGSYEQYQQEIKATKAQNSVFCKFEIEEYLEYKNMSF